MPLTTMLGVKPLRFCMPDSWLIISCIRYPGERGVWSIRGQSSTEIGGKVYSERDERERKDVTKTFGAVCLGIPPSSLPPPSLLVNWPAKIWAVSDIPGSLVSSCSGWRWLNWRYTWSFSGPHPLSAARGYKILTTLSALVYSGRVQSFWSK